MERWKPNVTVATVIDRVNQEGEREYLLVHETRDGKNVYNQPAGHLDEGEDLTDAAIRETLEETGWEVELTGLIGIYRFTGANGITYLRHVFSAKALTYHPTQPLDEGIIEAVWLTYPQVVAKEAQMRSHMVSETIKHYEENAVFSLDVFR